MKKALCANVIESGYDAFDGIGCMNYFYFITYMNEKFDVSVFEKSLLHICNVFPKTKSTMGRGFFHDSWREIQNFTKKDLQIEYYSVEAFDKDGFEKNVILAIENQKEITLDIAKQYPFKVIIYSNMNLRLTALLFCFHHAFCDGRGACNLIKYIGEAYNSILFNKEPPPFKNYYDIALLTKKLYKTCGIKKNKKDPSDKEKNTKKVLPIFNAMYHQLEKNRKQRYRSLEKIVICKERFLQLKTFCEKNEFTINDFVMLVVLMVTQKYNRQLPESSKFIGCSITVDLRKYLDTEVNTIGNYAAFDIFLIDSNTIEKKDFAAFREALRKFKKKILGLDFFVLMNKLNVLPIGIVRPIIRKCMMTGIESRDKKSLSISNCGELTSWFSVFQGVMYDAIFIPSICFESLPQIGVSSYNDVMTLNIVKENDYNDCAVELRKQIELFIDGLV